MRDSDAEADDSHEGARDAPDSVNESAGHRRGGEGEPEASAEKAEEQMRNFLEEMEERQHGPGSSGPTRSFVSKHN